MDEGTLELLRCLQSGPYDESSWKQIRDLLRTQRRVLRAQQDSSTAADLVQLLESWSEAAEDPRIASEALREAADIADRELTNPELAADFRKRAVSVSHTEEKPRVGTNPHASLAQRRIASGDLDGAIDAYERALNVEADTEIVGSLAELYARRGNEGDAQQAADLYFTLGDVLGNPAGIPQLELALTQVPDHPQALALLAEFTGQNAPQQEPQKPRSSRQRTIAGAAAAPVPPALTPENTNAVKAPPTLRKVGGGLRPKLRPGTKAPVISIMNKSPQGAPVAHGAAAIGFTDAPLPEAEPSIEPSLAPEPIPATTSRGPAAISSLSPVVVDEERALERSRERLVQMRARKRKIALGTVAGGATLALAAVLILPRAMQDAQQPEKHALSQTTDTSAATTTTTTQAATQPPPPAAAQPQPQPAAEPPKAPEPEPAAAEAKAEPAPAATPSTPEPKPAHPAPSIALEPKQFELRGGKWSDAQLNAAIDKLKPKLDQCYATALEKRPRLKGKLGVAFTVKLNGKAASVKKQGGTLKDADLVRCTLDAVGETRYPKPRKQAMSVKLPLEFRKSAG